MTAPYSARLARIEAAMAAPIGRRGSRPWSVSPVTGAAVTGWDACQERIRVLFSTPVGSRVMRRDYGSEIPRLIDAPMTQRTLLEIYDAIATALALWEPCYEMTDVQFTAAGADGRAAISGNGIYYPLGHLGDRSIAEPKALTNLVIR